MTYRQRQLRKKYVRVVKVGPDYWETRFNPTGDHGQSFIVVSGATKPEADYFARMLAKGMERLLKMEAKP